MYEPIKGTTRKTAWSIHMLRQHIHQIEHYYKCQLQKAVTKTLQRRVGTGCYCASEHNPHVRVSCLVSVDVFKLSVFFFFFFFFFFFLLTWSAVVKCDGLAFGAFPGCVTRCFTLTSRFLPPRPAKVYTTQCRHFVSFFLIFRACKESWDTWGHEGS